VSDQGIAVIDTKADIRLDAWRGVFEKTNRILSGMKVTVSIIGAGNVPQGMQDVPGWSDGVDINLNGPVIDKMLSNKDTLSAVLRLKGLNYHELCHVLYTPRMTDELPRRIIDKSRETGDTTWWYAFNALEDQRIETWFTSTYTASRRYFEATVLEWILREGSAESAILIYGRKYLSPRIRVQAGRVFRKKYGKALYDEFQTVIDEYVTLVLPTESVKGQQLIAKYHELLKKMRAASGAPLPVLVVMDNGMGGSTDGSPDRGSCDVARTGRVMVKEARRARDRAADSIEDAIDADLAEEMRRQAEADGQGEDGGPEGKGASAGQPGESGADISTQGDQSSSGRGGSDSGDVGTGVSDTGTADHVVQKGQGDGSLKSEMDDLMDHVASDMDDVRNDEQVQEDVNAVLDAVKAVEQNGRMRAKGAAARNAATVAPNESTNLAVRRVVSILTRIRQEAEPETLRRQHSGRVDARRALSRQPHEVDVFTNWDHGTEEETGIEAVLLVDVSGSMGGMVKEASAAMWALKRAFDKLDIRTTVMLYDTEHTILWQPTDRANPSGIPQVNSGGGTNPTSALEQAVRILSKSQQPNRVLITVTDGQWGGDEKYIARLLKTLHKYGTSTLLLGLGNAVTRYGKHSHMEAHDMRTIRELPKVALKLVSSIMRNAGSV
jgi:Mg-chelatase subunit ChlD